MVNGWTKLPQDLDPNYVPELPAEGGQKKGNKEFGLTISPTKGLEPIKEEPAKPNAAPSKTAAGSKPGDKNAPPAPAPVEEDAKEPEPNYLEPKPRSQGGIWLQAEDFPHAFNFLLLFHNPQKFKHSMIYKDLWESSDKTYKVDEKDVYIKISLKEEAQVEESKDKKDNKAPAKGAKVAEEQPK